ncbi:MAG: patatin-like phospholipase family protein [Burkholderiales bacterium]|nr:patatin-like phospholipase family protein [Burkholderiales bacterium]
MELRMILVSALIMLGALAGCGTTRPTLPPENLACGLVDNGLIVQDALSPVLNVILRKRLLLALGEPTPSFNVLSLSAGGEFGAYGAAFLGGWRSAGVGATPVARGDIQIVTGVSTGSLIATHAFLGEEDVVENKFRTLSGADVYKARSALALIHANSLFDSSGKDAIIDLFIDSGMIDRVAAQPVDHRLYIGTVDLDSGEFLRIDMVKLAQTIEPKGLRDACYKAIIGASSAIPIAFSPKFIDGRMLVDGGARRFLFFTDLSADAKKLGVARNLISLVHGDLQAGAEVTPNGVLQIAGRLSSVSSDQILKDSIFLQEAISTSCIAGVGMGCPTATSPAAPFVTMYAAAAAAAKHCAPKKAQCATTSGLNGEDMFCNPFMNCLADEGRVDGADYGSGRKPWLKASQLNLSSRSPADALLHTPMQ